MGFVGFVSDDEHREGVRVARELRGKPRAIHERAGAPANRSRLRVYRPLGGAVVSRSISGVGGWRNAGAIGVPAMASNAMRPAS